MNTSQFISEVINKIRRRKSFIILSGLLFGALLCLYAITKPRIYVAQATIFPLTSSSDNTLASNALGSLLGLSDAPKSFSSDAAINIIELALSRNVRESVASARLSEFGNKKIVELLVDEMNAHKSFLSKKTELPKDSAQQAIFGGDLIKPFLTAKMNKNSVLELYFSSTNEKMLQPVTETIINKISQFYIDLRIKKAIADYTFTLGKIDSLQQVLARLDNRAINMQNSTYFTPEILQYELPKENLSGEKQRAEAQRNMSINNREEALWRLQKVTPIIEVLDKPTPPYDVVKPSAIVYTIIGLILGIGFAIFVLTFRLMIRFAKGELKKSLMTDEQAAESKL